MVGGAGERAERVTVADLREELGLSSAYLAKRFFTVFDTNGDGRLTRRELVAELERLADGTPAEKLRFAFDVHDEDGNGVIDRDELERMLHIALTENHLVVPDATVEELTRAMMRHVDADGDERIDFGEFQRALEHFPGVVEHMTLGDLRWLGVGRGDPATRSGFEGGLGAALRTHGAWVTLLVLWTAANAFLFWSAWSRYGEAGAHPLVQAARGCGACLNLNAALIFVPMMRRALSWLGRTRVGRLLIDDHVGFHRLVGSAALAFGVAHGACHLANYARGQGIALGLQSVAGATGAVLLGVHLVMWLFARARRRRGRFELFQLTHALYPVWALVLLVHGPLAWAWMGVPLLLFLVDRLSRRPRRSEITQARPLASRVTKLTVARPAGFDFTAGDYAFVRIPAIAKAEWHPFTLSSAPERDDEFTFHVRTVGDWTGKLRELAEAGAAPLDVDIDGPYGTASAQVVESKVAVLVGAGIGVTPFASVLESLAEQRARGRASGLEQVYFVWVSRDQAAFEWFAALLGRLEREHPEFFAFHIFMDAGRTDLSSTVLRVAMDVRYADTHEDLVTGLRSRTTLGAPDWRGFFTRVRARHAAERVDVFFCGPPGLGKKVERAATRAGCPFRQEHF